MPVYIHDIYMCLYTYMMCIYTHKNYIYHDIDG